MKYSILLLLLISIIFTSCKKSNSNICWRCENRGNVAGIHYSDTTICNKGEYPSETDANGNNITGICTKQ